MAIDSSVWTTIKALVVSALLVTSLIATTRVGSSKVRGEKDAPILYYNSSIFISHMISIPSFFYSNGPTQTLIFLLCVDRK
jgi:hypothetical protein